MCGKQATVIAKIEGAQLTVCEACARHGTLVKRLPQVTTTTPKRKVATQQAMLSRAEPKEELIETVRPDVAKILRQEREKRKLNHEQFAAKLQIRASTYHHYESGATKPDTVSARKIEKVIGIPLVGYMKVFATPTDAPHEEQRNMMLGDFMKKKK